MYQGFIFNESDSQPTKENQYKCFCYIIIIQFKTKYIFYA